jgi:hypothetical protein
MGLNRMVSKLDERQKLFIQFRTKFDKDGAESLRNYLESEINRLDKLRLEIEIKTDELEEELEKNMNNI